MLLRTWSSIMGNTNCLLTDENSTPKGKKVLHAKFETSVKTGVLNLANQDLRPTSSSWVELSQPLCVEKLVVLDISGNALKIIPEEVYDLINLKTLIVNRCHIQRLHDLTVFRKLHILRLQSNDLESDTVHDLPASLQHLTLSYNLLVQLPTSLYSLVHLVTLDLNNNRIESIYGIERLESLRELLLDGNCLRELPPGISQLTKLHTISIAHNAIHKISSQTGLQSIPRAVFAMPSLQALLLTGNPLSKNDVLAMEGVEDFLVRRKLLKDKTLHGGGWIDHSLFGLD